MIYYSENIPYLQFKSLKVNHFISTRIGGVSTKPYDSLNVGFPSGDNLQSVLKNRTLAAEAFGISLQDIVTGKQTHKDIIHAVTEKDKGKGANDNESALQDTDALITNIPNIVLMVKTADCVPLLIYDPIKRVIATIHAGWRGTAIEITKKTVLALKRAYDCNPDDLIVGIGPSIGACCFEVQNDVVSQFKGKLEKSAVRRNDSKTYLDLQLLNNLQLIEAGVRAENIEVSSLCTSCRNDIFFSARKDHITGRFASFIWLN